MIWDEREVGLSTLAEGQSAPADCPGEDENDYKILPWNTMNARKLCRAAGGHEQVL